MWLLLHAWIVLAADVTALRDWALTRPVPPDDLEVAEGYRFAGQVFEDIAGWIEASDAVVEIEHLGPATSLQPLWAIHVSPKGPPPEREVLVFAGIHAMEWITTEVAADLLEELLAVPVPDTRVTVIPLLNPDGRNKVERDLAIGLNRFRRGNLTNVDLNRDFGVHSDSPAIWSALIPSRYHHSGYPVGQPETRALDRLLRRHDYERAASLHAFGGYFFYPWSGRYKRPEAAEEHVALGRLMEQAQGGHAYRTRQLGRWGFFFRAQGSEIDHIHGLYGTTAYLVELTRSGFDWRAPFRSWNTMFRRYNPADRDRHVTAGLAAMRVLVRHTDPLPRQPKSQRERAVSGDGDRS